MLERRNCRRQRVCLEGRITIDPARPVLEVRVRNLSDHGAEIVAAGGRLAASSISFETSRDVGRPRAASVVWWRLDHYGLRFDDEPATAVPSMPVHPWSRYSPSDTHDRP